MRRSRLARGPVGWLGALTALPGIVRLYVCLMRDPRVGPWPKLIVVAALVYLISPLDLVPDFLVPVVGQLDDIAILWLAFRALVRLSPPEVVAEHREGTPPRGG